MGGTYRGGSRTVHDVNNSKAFVFSCRIGDARFNDKTHLLSGFSTIAGETCTLDYGDLVFLDTFADGGLTDILIDSEATAVNTEFANPWPYTALRIPKALNASTDALGNAIANPLKRGEIRPGEGSYAVVPFDESLNEATTEATWVFCIPSFVATGTFQMIAARNDLGANQLWSIYSNDNDSTLTFQLNGGSNLTGLDAFVAEKAVYVGVKDGVNGTLYRYTESGGFEQIGTSSSLVATMATGSAALEVGIRQGTFPASSSVANFLHQPVAYNAAEAEKAAKKMFKETK